jgi:seryl-tRNA(Sec) selenium transferase
MLRAERATDAVSSALRHPLSCTHRGREIVVQPPHRNAYDHAVRAARARPMEVGYPSYPAVGGTAAWQVEAAIGAYTVALYWATIDPRRAVPLEELCRITHAHGLPVIVDAAAILPAADELRRFVAGEAGWVSCSGTKR